MQAVSSRSQLPFHPTSNAAGALSVEGSSGPRPDGGQAHGNQTIGSDGAKSSSDEATITEEGLRALQAEQAEGVQASTHGADQEQNGPKSSEDLSEKERAQVRELQARDAEVRAHEQAHKAAAGNLASGAPSYEYQKGPDGKDYAVGGEVGISVAEGDTPEETLSNAQRVQRAAQAPANPSSQDRRVAAQAAQMASDARAEIQAQRGGEDEGGEGEVEETAGQPEAMDQEGGVAAQASQAYSQVHGQVETPAQPSLLDLVG